MKKILLIALASLLAFTFVSCSGDTPNTPTEKSRFEKVPRTLWGKWEKAEVGTYFEITENDIILHYSKSDTTGTSLFSLYKDGDGSAYNYSARESGEIPSAEDDSYCIFDEIGHVPYDFQVPTTDKDGKRTMKILMSMAPNWGETQEMIYVEVLN